MKVEELRDSFDWQEAFKYAARPERCEGYTGHNAGAVIDDVVEVIASSDGDNDGPPWIGVFRLADGRFLFLTAGCDYTGWGCCESGQSWVAGDLETLTQFGIGYDDRERLGL